MRTLTCMLTLMQLDLAAPALAALKEPVVIAKLNADKYRKLASKYEIEYAFFMLFSRSFF